MDRSLVSSAKQMQTIGRECHLAMQNIAVTISKRLKPGKSCCIAVESKSTISMFIAYDKSSQALAIACIKQQRLVVNII